MTNPRRVLVVGPSWVGDMVMAQSLFKALRRRDPQVHIEVLAPGWSRPLLDRMPEVADSIDMPVGHGSLQLGLRYRLGLELRGRRFDQAILLPNSLKSALIPYFARIPLRTGWRGEMRYGLLNDVRVLDRQILTMTVQRFVALALPAGEPLPEIESPTLVVEPVSVRASLAALSLGSDRSVLALCPGAEYGPAKQWPAEYYAELAKRYAAQGWQVWLFGSDKDRAVCGAVNQAADGGCQDLAGRTSLSQAVDLLSVADAVVSNDSGLMHVAAALGRPLAAVYGSSDPCFTPPLSESSRVLSLGLDCSPCFKRECPLGHLRCLRDLGVDQVAAALAELRG